MRWPGLRNGDAAGKTAAVVTTGDSERGSCMCDVMGEEDSGELCGASNEGPGTSGEPLRKSVRETGLKGSGDGPSGEPTMGCGHVDMHACAVVGMSELWGGTFPSPLEYVDCCVQILSLPQHSPLAYSIRKAASSRQAGRQAGRQASAPRSMASLPRREPKGESLGEEPDDCPWSRVASRRASFTWYPFSVMSPASLFVRM
jgi:hypothetical protein